MSLNISQPTRTSGSYGYAPVGAIIDTDPAAMWGDVNGIPMGMQYFYGSVRSAAGDYWWPIRGFYPDRARFLHLSESKAGGDFTYAKDHDNSYSGPVEHGEREGKWGVWTPDGTPLMLTWDDRMEWHDGEEVSLAGHLVGEGGSHAWVEVLRPVDDLPGTWLAEGWDPTHDRRAGADYLIVAVGPDYREAAPLWGTYEGDGVPSSLTVTKRLSV